MARNAERANAVLNKWLAVKDAVLKGVATREKRPRDVSQCTDAQQAEKWRSEVMREIGRMIAQVQDASLGEHRIRDLNDDINKMIRVKKAWETRIKEGVRELLEREALEDQKPRVTRAMLFKRITPDYYGWRDEDDGELLLAEHAKEMELQREAEGAATNDDYCEGGEKEKPEEEKEEKVSPPPRKKKKMESSRRKHPQPAASEKGEKELNTLESYVGTSTAEEIVQLLLEKKKQVLLQKYVSKQQSSAEEETRALAKQR